MSAQETQTRKTVDPASLLAELRHARPVARVGRIASIAAGKIQVTGLTDVAAMGELVAFEDGSYGEVIEIGEAHVTVLSEAAPDGMVRGSAVRHLGPAGIAPDAAWVGRIVDPFGRPLDGRPLLRGPDMRPLIPPHGNPADRRGLGSRLATGQTLFDTLLPIARGQRIGLFAGPGVGKSTLLGRLATGIEADVVIVALIGERGRELREFTDKILGAAGLEKSIVVAATADQSPLLRRRCAYTAMTLAEHFRDAGSHVLLLADSVTRFADAHREIALAAGEAAGLGGYPASVAQRIMALAERAGPGTDTCNDITAIFTVLVSGEDMDGPLADILRGVLDGHVILDRAIAERGRFPAVDILRSVSRALPGVATADEVAMISDARRMLAVHEDAALMVQAGLYQPGSDADIDRALEIVPRLEAFVQARAPGGISESFSELAGALVPDDAGVPGSEEGLG
ncbi:MAG: FliI/YscN family ATPase [Pseudomonadota bacterium]